ncbi:MAG: hypothetical protein Q9221_008682 [Calogaya cf. arnoldii]
MPPNPEPRKRLRAIFEQKPPPNEINRMLAIAEKRTNQYWEGLMKKFKEKHPLEIWESKGPKSIKWFLGKLEINQEQEEVVFHVEYLKLYAESVVEWEDAMGIKNRDDLKEKVVKPLMEKLGMLPSS